MRTLTASISLASLLLSPPHHHHHYPNGLTPKLVTQYDQAYHAVARRFRSRAPGRYIVRYGLANGHTATKKDVVASLATLRRMLDPPRATAPVASSSASTVNAGAVTTSTAPTGSTASYGTSGASSGLAACIIQHESGGNPQATNGQYGGIGQWSAAAWAEDGGTKYASKPTGASYSQQAAVLNGEGTAGMESQQAQYDGC